jgi:peptidoglycan-N-acetylglucosamine deacetylase
MMLFAPLIHPPKFIRRWWDNAWWSLDQDMDNAVYLTFDDGPVPEATPWVLETLAAENVKATFFCVGDNVSKYPELYQQIIDQGHSTGNHTYNHLQGIKTANQLYYRNIRKASSLIDSNLFRPPHGLMKPEQYRFLSNRYQIVMWDIVTMDYHPTFTPAMIFENVARHVKKGSIITFHDSVKSIKDLKIALPMVIKMLKDSGYQLSAIPYIPFSTLHLQRKCDDSFMQAS